MNRDLDAEIVEKVYGWKLTRVGPDANGENTCEILCAGGRLPTGWVPPALGHLHRGILAPPYSSNREVAIKLAVHVGMKMDISEIDFTDYTFAEKLARRALEHFETR